MKKLFYTVIFSIFVLLSFTMVVNADSIGLEAEDFSINANFILQSSKSASGNEYLEATVNDDANDGKTEANSNFPKINAESSSFSVKTSGEHTIWIRVANPSDNNGDSVYVAIDKYGKRNGKLNDIHFVDGAQSFRWKKVDNVTLSSSESYTIRLYSRESGARIDKVLITSNLSYVPDGKVYTLPYPISSETSKLDSIAFEAEDFTIEEKFYVITNDKNSNASGDGYIQANANEDANDDKTEANSSFSKINAESPNFSIGTSGEYVIWIRVANPSDNYGDSVYVTLDKQGERNGKLNAVHFAKGAQELRWKRVTSTNLSSNETYTIRLYSRESGAVIDKILLTNNLYYVPDGKVDILPSPTYSEDDLPIAPPSFKPIDTHPRLLVNSTTLQNVKANLNHHQNASVYQKVRNLAAITTYNGCQESYSSDLLEIMQAKAFMYLVNNDTEMGRQAIIMLENYMSKFTLGNVTASAYTMRYAGHFIFSTACVYDWCYDLLDTYSFDKTAYINKCEKLAKKYFEGGYPIIEAPGIVSDLSHRAENPIYKDLLALGIAVYGDNNIVYDHVAAVVVGNYVPWCNEIYQSGWNPQGVYTYGIFRTYWETIAQYLFKTGTTNQSVFSSLQENMAYKYIYMRRPDGGFVMDADETIKCFNNTFHCVNQSTLFLIGNMYNNPAIKWQYYHDKADTNYLNNDYTGISAPMYLLINDTSVPIENNKELPYTNYFKSPVGAMVARTGWQEGANSPDAIAVMKPFENYFAGHMHREVGSFEFYYKGMLALDSGAYEANGIPNVPGTGSHWGESHYMNYLSAPIAHNILAVYDKSNPNEIANGGQRMEAGAASSPTTFEEYKAGSNKTGEIIGYDYGPDKVQPEYSYIEGDLTEGYRNDRVSDYSRSFMFLNLEDKEIPAALIVYDRIESTDSSYTKSWLLHSQENPEINGNQVIIHRNEAHNSGRLTDTVLLPHNADIDRIGGEGYEYYNGNANQTIIRQDEGDESGTWRVEVKPNTSNSKDYFLNVMQVSDDDDSITPLEVTSNEQGNFIGVFIKDKAVFMKKDKGNVSSTFDVTAIGNGEISYIITNLAEGTWMIKTSEGSTIASYNVASEHGVLRFRAQAGTYTLIYTSKMVPEKVFNTKVDAKTLDYTKVSIYANNNYIGKAVLKDGKIMVAINDFADLTKSKYFVNGQNFTASGGKGIISGTADSTIAIINGEQINLSVVPQIIDGYLYVPLDALEDVFSFEYTYDSVTNIMYFEYVPSYKINLDNFTLENPMWIDQTGNKTDTFTAGSCVTFKSKITNLVGVSGTSYPATLYIVFYNGDMLKGIYKETINFTKKGEEGYFNLTVRVPDDADGSSPRFFMWDNHALTPLLKDGFGGDISSIALNGIQIPDFNKSTHIYNVILPDFKSAMPEITCTGSYFGTVLSATATDGQVLITVNTEPTSKSYTINYTKGDAPLTVIYDSNVNEDDPIKLLSTQYNMISPNFETSKTLGEILNGRESIIGLASPVYYDKNYIYYESVPPELQGLNYYPLSFTEDTATQGTIEVETKKNVRIYFSSNDSIVNNGATKLELSSPFKLRKVLNISQVISDAEIYDINNIYYYDLIIPYGVKTATVKLNVLNTENTPIQLFYEYLN